MCARVLYVFNLLFSLLSSLQVYTDVDPFTEGQHWDRAAGPPPGSEERWPCGGFTQMGKAS